MDISIKTDAADVAKMIQSASTRQIDFALRNTVNDLAFAAKKDHKRYVNQVFDRPTRWTENATEAMKATRKPGSMRYLTAWVQLKPEAFKGVGATQYLKAQAMGGTRADKRSEKALRAKGILPQGYQTLVMPKYQDKHGNIRGPLMVKILSYLRAFSEQGYNMNRPYIPAGAKGISKTALKAAYRTKAAMQKDADKYFVLYKTRTDGQGRRNVSDKSRPIGIFERKAGTAHSGFRNIEPVLMFIPMPKYTKRYDLPGQVSRVVRRDWYRTWKLNYSRALASMKIRKY